MFSLIKIVCAFNIFFHNSLRNLLMLKILLERQEVTAAYPGDIDIQIR